MQLTYVSVSMAVLPSPAATEVSQPSLPTRSVGCRLCSWLHPAHWALSSVFSISHRECISAQRSWPVKCKDLAVLLTPKQLWWHSNACKGIRGPFVYLCGELSKTSFAGKSSGLLWRPAQLCLLLEASQRGRMGLVRHGCQCGAFHFWVFSVV